jgi:hypothetical protein
VKGPRPLASYLLCRRHGRVRGFIICSHVLAGQVVDRRVEPTREEPIGEIMCELESNEEHELDELKPICATCAQRFQVGVAVAPRGVES